MLQNSNTGPFVSYWQFSVADVQLWREQTLEVVNHLQTMPGFVHAQTLRYVDEPKTVALCVQWQSVGQYRKALSAGSSKLLVWPYLMNAIEVPGAFETLDLWQDNEHQAFDSSVSGDE